MKTQLRYVPAPLRSRLCAGCCLDGARSGAHGYGQTAAPSAVSVVEDIEDDRQDDGDEGVVDRLHAKGQYASLSAGADRGRTA